MSKKFETEHWTNIVRLMYDNRNDVHDLLADDEIRVRIQFFFVFVIFSIISSVMTIMNVVTNWRLLMYSTLFFAIANLINALLMLINADTEKLAKYLFSVEMLVLFTFFVVCGEPEGFSAIWIALLPGSGLLLYRMKYGTVLTAVQFLILVFFLWTPWGRSLLMYDYTESFMERFPVLFLAFFSVGAFFEYIRYNTQRELVSARQDYEELSKRDPLTGLYNRFGFYSSIDTILNAGSRDGYAMAIVDFDAFKQINDTYGHSNGDEVLTVSAKEILSIVGEGGSVCRWGGDEIAVFFHSSVGAEKLCNDILTSIRNIKFNFNGIPHYVSVSIGLITIPSDIKLNLSDLITAADNNLYFSKSNGKNRLSVTAYGTPPDNDPIGNCS